jgi:hypothetical protein
MKFETVILDKISCQCFVNWTYEENSETPGRIGLLNIQLNSAMNASADKKPFIAITSVTKKELEEHYNNDLRGMCHVSSIVECSEELNMPLHLTEEDSIIKSASILKWKGIKFCIVTGNSLIYDTARKYGFETFEIKDSAKAIE